VLDLRAALLMGLAAAGFADAAETPLSGAVEDDVARKPVMLVLDFDSPSDNGALGKQAAYQFRAKMTRYRLFSIIEDMDREEIEKKAGFKAAFDTPPQKILDFAKATCQPDLVMWGKVEPAGGEQVRLFARVMDCAAGPEKLRLDTSILVPSRYAMQVGVFKILGQLTGREDPRYEAPPPDVEERWARAPNLIGAVGFETGKDRPDGWESFGPPNVMQMNEVHWEKNPDQPGRCIVMRMSEAVAGMEGDYYFSNYLDIEPGATYRLQYRVKTMSPTCKIFVKYYQWMVSPGEKEGQWREVYRTQINCRTKHGEWVSEMRYSHPRTTLIKQTGRIFTPKKCRIGLYAYWPAGVVYWDDVVFKKVAEPPKDLQPFEVGQPGRKPFERPE